MTMPETVKLNQRMTDLLGNHRHYFKKTFGRVMPEPTSIENIEGDSYIIEWENDKFKITIDVPHNEAESISYYAYQKDNENIQQSRGLIGHRSMSFCIIGYLMNF